jgi:transcriptional regulator with XRE-family HTH domain
MSDHASVEPQDGPGFFGSEVRHAREHPGGTQQDLADATHYQRSYVSRVESGSLLASESFAEACDAFFNTSGYFARLRRRVSERGHPSWFAPYVKQERLAHSILDFSATLIMGMLQTPAYAEAVFRAAHPRDLWDAIKARVDARLARREVMEREDPPLLWVILSEACLRTVVGGPAVMHDQLAYLVAQVDSPDVTLQVLPFAAGAPPASESFTLLTFDEAPTVVYADSALSNGQMIDSATGVARASGRYDRLRAAALSPTESLAVIKSLMKEYAR